MAKADGNRVTPRVRAVGPCPGCGENSTAFFFRGQDQCHGVPGEFTYRRCDVCGTVFQDPVVISDDLGLCYPEGYPPHVFTANAEACIEASRIGRRLRDRLRQAVVAEVRNAEASSIERLLGRVLALSRRIRLRAFYDFADGVDEFLPWTKDDGRALDIGCGAGRLMLSLMRLGWKVEGVEWNSYAAESAIRRTERPVHVGDFQELHLPQAAYDLVILHHVLEHLHSPRKALERIAELLAPNGRAVVVYPNCESIGVRILGHRWFPWEVPRHLVLPSSRALLDQARKTNLIPLRVRSTGRNAAAYFSMSRCGEGGINDSRADWFDWVMHLFENLCVVAGLPVGEEWIITLRHGDLRRH